MTYEAETSVAKKVQEKKLGVAETGVRVEMDVWIHKVGQEKEQKI